MTGDACDNEACGLKPGCDAKAEEILWLDPGEMEEAIHAAATELGFTTAEDKKLFADFVYDKALGAGASGNLGTDVQSPF